ncbi:MAG: outer membrane protein assembly factor BamE [Burkholderiaceae bacterium]|nr:outer membrane protein assembly factor BamE [Burkholderiaceae bacterium]
MPAKYRRSAQLGLTAIACAVLAGCGSFSSLSGTTDRVTNIFRPYRIEIVQGNFVSSEQVAALQRGMTRSQVREVLGTPLMTDVFHTDRWDYVFTLKRQGVEPQSRKLTLRFQGDQLDKWEGDAMPSEAEFVAQLDNHSKANAKVPMLEVPEEVLKEFNLKNPPVARSAVPVVAAGAATTAYPPLEAPGTTTQAWDGATQRAVVAAAAARPVTQAPAAAPSVSVAAAAPARVSPAVVAPAVVAAAAPAPSAVAAPSAAPVVRPAAAPSVATASAAVPAPAIAAPPALPPVSVGFGGLDPEVSGFLNGWMNDWQARNSGAFFLRYAPEFKGTSATRAEWEAQRRPSIESRVNVSLAVQDVRGVMVSPGVARVVFRQVYDSDAGSEIGTKALFLVKRDGRWLIEREFFTPAR